MSSPSSEQQHVIHHLRESHNVVVDACAGSGKSTTVLSAAQQMRDRRFIQLTFNRALSAEIAERIHKLGLANIRVFTYHSLLVNFYHSQGYTDQEMRWVVNTNSAPYKELPPMDVLVIDEAQDMSMLYFRFIVKFCKDLGTPLQIMVLGDEQQALYAFNGSDTRFLTQAASIWQDLPLLKSPVFQACTLQTSYRVTLSMARFVNEIMMGKTKMLSTGRHLSPVVYVRQTNVAIAKMIAKNICDLLDLPFWDHNTKSTFTRHIRRRPGPNAKYAEQDIFILAQSVRHTNFIVAMIESHLTYNGISCYLPSSDEIEIDERVTANKVVFSSFCRAKGRQRKIVYVVGFDQTHFRFKSDVDPADWIHCQNDLYVACTRASEHLCVCESDGNTPYHQPLHFLKLSEDEIREHEMVRYTGTSCTDPEQIPPPKLNPIKNTSATELIRFISEPVMESIEAQVKSMFKIRHYIGKQGPDEDGADEEWEDEPMNMDDPFSILQNMGVSEIQDQEDESGSDEYSDEYSSSDGDSTDESSSDGSSEVNSQSEEIEKEQREKEQREKEKEKSARQLGLLDIPCLVQIQPDTDLYEDVSAINGIVIPYMFFDRRNPQLMRKDIRYFSKNLKQHHPYLFNRAQMLPDHLNSTTDYLEAGAILHSISDKMLFRLLNLDCTGYDWLAPDILANCMNRLEYIFENEPPRYHKTDDEYKETEETEETEFEEIKVDQHQHQTLTESLDGPGESDVQTTLSYWDEMHAIAAIHATIRAEAQAKKARREEKERECENADLIDFQSDQDIIEHSFLSIGENDPRYARIDKAVERLLPGMKVRFGARLDYVSKGHVWELKCCNDLVFSHFLQVVIYAWLWRMTDVEREECDDVRGTADCVFHLYNVRTNEHYELDATTEELEHVVGVLLRGKYAKEDPPVDDSFIETCRGWVRGDLCTNK